MATVLPSTFSLAPWLCSPSLETRCGVPRPPRGPLVLRSIHRRRTAVSAARRVWRQRRSRSQWFPVTFVVCAGLVVFLLRALTDDHFTRSFLHHWHRWWRHHRSWFRGDRLVILAALLFALLSAPQRAERRGGSGNPRGTRRRVVRPPVRAPAKQVLSQRSTLRERRQNALDQLHAALQEGNTLRAAILIDTWGQGDSDEAKMDPLQRPELQILLEEAARHAPQLLPVLAEQLERRGVALDWSLGNDCRSNFGRYALDAALEVLVKEMRNEPAALSLLSLGQGSGKGDTAQLDADPLMRAAAAQGMTRLVERLVKECGADVNSKDPRFGSSALDRALDAGKEQTSLKLLQLGADPTVGKGVDYVLARAGPKVRAQLPLSSSMRSAAKSASSEVDFSGLRGKLQKTSERMVLQQLENQRFSKVQLAQLLQEAARIGYKPRLLRQLYDTLGAEIPLNWDEADATSDAAFARRPLDVALETAVETFNELLPLVALILHQKNHPAAMVADGFRSWREVRESYDLLPLEPQPDQRRPSQVLDSSRKRASEGYPVIIPAPEPWLGQMLPDVQEDGAPWRAGLFWTSFGGLLGVFRGAAVAFLSDGRSRSASRCQAFMVGFMASAPWYMSMLGLSGVLSVYAARAERAGRKRSAFWDAESHPACDLG
eukprot:s341_g21.t1